MDKWILKALLLFVFLNALILVVSGGRFCNNPTPPLCADDCNGNGYYLNEGGTECIQCPTCPAGQELNKACGNGKNGDADGEAVCRPCADGFFSTSTSRHCSPCTTCINTVELEACQGTQDRVCGDCLPGFARSSGRFSAESNACPERIAVEPLEPAPVDQPVPVEPLDALDACEPQPPRCIDPCYDGNYYVGNDGLCKACLQCQPGEELNKVCGRGKNGDAYCQQCPKGTFSEYGIGRCTPCRICVNTVATECTATTDSVCGECLPGYYQDADGFFPDKEACPNKCTECPTTIPQCQVWCESEAEEVTKSATQPSEQDAAVSPQAVLAFTDDASGQNTVLPPAEPDFPSVTDKKVKKEVDYTPANHASYTTIFIVLASLLTVIIVILIIVLGVFRHFWKKTSSNVSITAETTLLPDQRTSSPGSSPGSSPSAVYNPTTSPIPSTEDQWEFIMRSWSTFFHNINGERPPSGSSTDSENRSSTASTPTLNLNRRLADRDLRRQALEKQQGPNDSSRSNNQHQPSNPQSCPGHSLVNSAGNMNRSGPSRPIQLEVPKPSAQEPTPNERSSYTEQKSSPRASSSHKVVTEKESGTAHQHVDDQNEVNGRHVRRRSSIISIVNEDDQVGSLPKDPRPRGRLGRRRYSMPCLPLSDGINMQKKESNGNIPPLCEREAALFPPDSSSDDGRTTNVVADTNNKKTTNPNHQSQPSRPITSSSATATGAGVMIAQNVPEKFPNETIPEKKSTHVGVGNSDNKSPKTRKTGSKSPRQPSLTININMNTKDIEKFQVGDVHNSHTYPHQNIPGSENQDEDDEEDEAEQLPNITTSENDTIPEPNNHTCSVEDDDEDEAERPLIITTSENDTTPEPDVHTCSDEDDDEDDEEHKLLDPE